MGDRLKEEAKSLKLIMWCFSLSYAFIAVFYLYELVVLEPCRQLNQCSDFESIMMLMTIAALFDFLPNLALYYCHFKVSSNTRQNNCQEKGSMRKSQDKVIVGLAILEVLPEASNEDSRDSNNILI